MNNYERRTKGGCFYLRAPDGRRTRLYITLEACARAAERGEFYTDEEYAALTLIRRAPAPRRSRKDAA